MNKIKTDSENNRRINIGIIGLGFVGGAVKHWFEQEKYPLFLYDKYKNIGSMREVNKADVIFICVPTPFVSENGRGFDDSAVWEVLPQIEGSKIIVIKSTVLPGSTKVFQEKFPQHKFLMNPEFLLANNAVNDFLNPDRQIVGCTKESRGEAGKIMIILPPAPFQEVTTASEAEMIKYTGNVFLSVRVIFANQIYDICQKAGIDYETVKRCVGADARIGNSHFDIFHDKYRGYGGACLPKDTKALIQFAQKIGVDPKLFETIEEINKNLIDNSKNK